MSPVREAGHTDSLRLNSAKHQAQQQRKGGMREQGDHLAQETYRVSLKLDPWVASEPYSILEFVHLYPASNSFLLFLRNLERIFDIEEWGKIKDKRSGSGEKERLKDIGWNGLIERKFNNFKWRAEGNCGSKLTVTEWLVFSLNWCLTGLKGRMSQSEGSYQKSVKRRHKQTNRDPGADLYKRLSCRYKQM